MTTTATDTDTAPWDEPGYRATMRQHHETLSQWYEASVRAGFINPHGDFPCDFETYWIGYPPREQQFTRIETWALAEVVRRGGRICVGPDYAEFTESGVNVYRDRETGEVVSDVDDGTYCHEDNAGDLAVEILAALDNDDDPWPLVDEWFR
jgi:hypothetical protein